MIRTKIILSLLLYFFCTAIIAQNTFHVKGDVKLLPSSQVYLTEIIGGKVVPYDSVSVQNGQFSFNLPETITPGVYRLFLDKEQVTSIDLILNKEDITFHTTYIAPKDSILFTASKENQLYYGYLHNNTKEKTLENMKKKDRGTLALSIITSEEPVKIPAGISDSAKAAYLDRHFFDNLDFSCPALTQSDVLFTLLVGYLHLHENPNYSFEEQAEQYAVVVDSILHQVKKSKTFYDFYYNKLTNIFLYGNYDAVGYYMKQYYNSDKMPADSAIDTYTRFHALKHTSLGTIAPDIIMTAYDGTVTKLSDVKTDYVLLVFWSSFCYHCTQTLPKIKQLYDHRQSNSFEILAVSFDTDQKQWQSFLQEGNYGWMNYCDLKGWDSPIAKSYNIQGTPTFILLDKNKMIIGKPAELDELVMRLRSLGLI
jgi:peroxiredoxin